MKLIYFSNELPRDDLQGLLRELHQLSRDRQHHTLARFLEDSTLAVRDEIRQLPAGLRAILPPFESIIAFADFPELRQGPLCESIAGILLCTVELGSFIA